MARLKEDRLALCTVVLIVSRPSAETVLDCKSHSSLEGWLCPFDSLNSGDGRQRVSQWLLPVNMVKQKHVSKASKIGSSFHNNNSPVQVVDMRLVACDSIFR